MDHYNVTVKDGALVSTRRGFLVSKSKHNGTAFVNSSAQSVRPKLRSVPTVSLPISGEIKFVHDGEDGRKSKRRTRTPEAREKTPAPRKPRAKKQQAQDELHLRPLTPASSSSPCSSSSVPFVGEKPGSRDGSEEACSSRTKSLPAWASYKLQDGISDSQQRLHFMTRGLGPTVDPYAEQGSFQDRYQKTTDEWRVQDPTSLHCVITLGALFDALQSGKPNSPALGKLASQLCAIIKRRLNDKKQWEKSYEVTIRAIATMAIIAGCQGKPVHWCVHMRGLINLINMAGGQHKLDAGTISIVRRADITGAVWAATQPCVPFIKRCSDGPPLNVPEGFTRTIASYLNSCHLDPTVADTIATTAAVSLDRHRSSGNRQPCSEPLIELYYDLLYRLLSKPEPLRTYDEVISPSSSQDLSLNAQDFPTPESSTAMDFYTKALESAMRILALLYIRDPTLGLPCAERVLLDLLAQHARTILADRQAMMFDNSLYQSSLPFQLRPEQRPCLIWLCIAGDVFTRLNTRTSPDYCESSQPAVFRELLSNVIGPDASINSNLVPDEDLELCRSWDLSYIEGQQWNERIAMRQILGEVKQEHCYTMPPPMYEH